MSNRLVPLLCVVVVSVTTLFVVPRPAAGSSAQPTTEPATAIRLSALDPWVQATDTVTATVRVSGAPAGSKLVPVLHSPVQTRSAFQLTTTGQNLVGTEAQLSEHELEPGSSTVKVVFSVVDGAAPPADAATPAPKGADVVTLTRPGVYPLAFTVDDADGVAVASMVTYVTRLPVTLPEGSGGRQPLNVATEFRLQPRPRIGPSGALTATDSARQATDALVGGLEGSTDAVKRSFGFSIAPSLVDALTSDPAGSASRDEDAARVLRLAALTDGVPVRSQPWSPVNLAGWLATPELAPRAARSVEAGDRVLHEHLHAPTSDTTDLAAWDGRASKEALRWFADRGTTAFLVPGDELAPLDTVAFPRTLAAPFDLDLGAGRTAAALQIDRALADHFTSPDPVLGANQLIADLSVIALDLPAIERGMVVAPPPGWTPDAEFLSAYTAALRGAHPSGSDPLLRPTSVREVVDSTPPARAAGDTASEGPALERSLRRGASPTPLSALGAQMSITGSLVDSLATMEPGGIAGALTLTDALHRQMGVAAMPGVAARDRKFAAIRSRITTTANSLRLPPKQTITLTADTASLPLTIRRTEDGPTEVLVHIDAPDRLDFPDGTTQKVHLDDVATRFAIRVHSDSPGDTIVRLTVTSPDEQIVVGTTEIVVRSTAASGVGFVISFGSLIFLILWWGRDIIRTRRRRRARHIPPAELIDID